MARYDARKERFEEVTVLGKPVLFTDIRIDRNTVPKGLYLYEVRSDDDGCGDPVQIAKGILVNHYGTILTSEPIRLPPDGYLDIDPEKDFAYTGSGHFTMKEYLRNHPLKEREKEIER